MSTSLTFTTANFVRSTGKQPRGRGSWAFRRSATATAFDRDLSGDVEFFNGTLSEAKSALKSTGATGLWAVLS